MSELAEPYDDEVEPEREIAWYSLPQLNLTEIFLAAEAETLAEDTSYIPEDMTREKMLLFAEYLRATGSKKLAAAAVGWSYRTVYKLEQKYAPFALVIDFAQQTVAGKVRAALVMKAVGPQQNVHAQIHLDKLYNREDFVADRQQEYAQITVAISATIRPNMIPMGNPTAVIDVHGRIPDMEADLGGASTDGPQTLAPSWLETDDRRLLAPANERGHTQELPDDDGEPEDTEL